MEKNNYKAENSLLKFCAMTNNFRSNMDDFLYGLVCYAQSDDGDNLLQGPVRNIVIPVQESNHITNF